jgi:hypothetical protein
MQHYYSTEEEQEARSPQGPQRLSSEGKLVSVFRLVPHTVLQSMYRDCDGFCELVWRPGHFSAHLCGMDKPKRLAMLKQIQDQEEPPVLKQEGDRDREQATGAVPAGA